MEAADITNLPPVAVTTGGEQPPAVSIPAVEATADIEGLVDAEVASLERDLSLDARRAYVASSIRFKHRYIEYAPKVSPDDPDIIDRARRRVEEERFLAGETPGAPVVKPRIDTQIEGIPFLQRLLNEIKPNKHPNLSVLTRIQRLLWQKGVGPRKKVTTYEKAKLLDYAEMPADRMVECPGNPRVTVAVAEIITKMAIQANCAPATVVQVLIYYGLEHAAQELRAHSTLPMPKIPSDRSKPAESIKKPLIGVA